jgi:hypothetical protein
MIADNLNDAQSRFSGDYPQLPSGIEKVLGKGIDKGPRKGDERLP